MSSDCLTDVQRNSTQWDSMIGQGYGNFMRVLHSPAAAGFNGTKGEYGWDGWTGNYITMDPSENMAFLYFIQKTDAGTTEEVRKLRMTVYASL